MLTFLKNILISGVRKNGFLTINNEITNNKIPENTQSDQKI